jgi:hypothetical protein
MGPCDVDSSLGSLHSADVDDIACISKVCVESVFRIEVCRVAEFPRIHSTMFTNLIWPQNPSALETFVGSLK